MSSDKNEQLYENILCGNEGILPRIARDNFLKNVFIPEFMNPFSKIVNVDNLYL